MSTMREHYEPQTGDTVVTTRISGQDLAYYGDKILGIAFEKIATEIANRFLADHAQDIMANINQQAVANLAVAQSAAAVNETIQKKLPDKIVEVVRTEREVYQRGIFGGLKKL